jgi:23S rRNA pseudouridine1911/1915/1917 synthase
VTRLDKDTSGIVLVALTPALHARMQRHGTAGRIRKQYLAVVRGIPVPGRGSIVLPLARSAEDRRRVVVTDTGQASETTYEVLSSGNRHSLVRCELVTGRTHQIRVHLAARGWPIVGDPVYGTADEHMTRQALHAWRVTLPHPITGTPLDIEAAMPADLQRLVADQNLTL